MLEFRADSQPTPVGQIRIIGVGGGGSRAVDRMYEDWPDGPPAALINTDADALEESVVPARLQIGATIARGMGAGGDVRLGRLAAEGDNDLIRGIFDETSLAFVVVALGGGVGTGAAPVVLKAAHDAGAMTICFATLPFDFEGKDRGAIATKGLRDLQDLSDAVVVMPNQRLIDCMGELVGLREAFDQADASLSRGVRSLWKLITSQGALNLDFADLRKVVQKSEGMCAFGYGEGDGDDADPASTAVERLVSSPLLINGDVLSNASAALVNVVAGASLRLQQISEVMERVREHLRKDAHVVVGAVTDPEWGDRLSITVFAAEQWNLRGPDVDEDESVELEIPVRGAAKGGRKRRTMTITQTKLRLEATGKGRFKDVDPTIVDGEDLDIPTYIRRGIPVEK